VSVADVNQGALTSPTAAANQGTRRSEAGSSGQVERLAQEFEAMLLLQMVRQMRQAMLEETTPGEGFGTSTMTDTFDLEFARYLSAVGGLGLSRVLAPHLPGVGTTPERVEVGAGPVGPATPATAVGSAGSAAGPFDVSERLHGGADGSPPSMGLPLEAPMTSAFGWRADPMTGTSRFHAGIDLGAAYGREVPTVAAGRVVFAGEQGGYGQTVVVEHAGGLRTRYAHLSAVCVQAGEKLAQGHVIGRVGQTGRSTGPHLHFEVSRDGQRLDPVEVARVWAKG
jgi:murein DD-endopeptidase MepM/ murein hydrolase activator NlpD